MSGFDPRWWTWLAVSIGLVALLVAGVCALIVVLPKEILMPSVEQLRDWWSKQIEDPARNKTEAQVTESILFGLDTSKDSPISAAIDAASFRACWFKWSAIALLAACVPLTGLVVDVLIRGGGEV